MNLEETAEAIKVMQAYVDGTDVEMYRRAQGFSNEHKQWFPHQGGWNWSEYEYRIKPELREWEVLPDEENWSLNIRQEGEGERGWIKVREVTE